VTGEWEIVPLEVIPGRREFLNSEPRQPGTRAGNRGKTLKLSSSLPIHIRKSRGGGSLGEKGKVKQKKVGREVHELLESVDDASSRTTTFYFTGRRIRK